MTQQNVPLPQAPISHPAGSLDVKLSRITLLTGTSGSGKTRLLQAARNTLLRTDPERQTARLGPETPDQQQFNRLWDRAGQQGRLRAAQALHRALRGATPDIHIPSGENPEPQDLMVQVPGREARVPPSHLPGGAARSLALVLAAHAAKGGLLTVDEFENGLHHSLLQYLWAVLLQNARQHGTQVLASTHSLDCCHALAYAASQADFRDVSLIRLENSPRGPRAVQYSPDEIMTAARQGIEVR